MAMSTVVQGGEGHADGVTRREVLAALLSRSRFIVGWGFLTGLVGLGVAFLLTPIFTARTVILPPQQQQSVAAAALSQLGSLASLAGGGLKTPADQYVSFMQSATVVDKIIQDLKLMDVYESKYLEDARKTLAGNSFMSVGRKDGLITIEVDDRDPKLAAAIANAYVDGLRRVNNTLAVTEAQQRRVFFEDQLNKTKQHLVQAQIALQGTGITSGAIKAEPKAAAEGYARLKAQITAAEVKLQAMRRMLADTAPELQQQQAAVGALRSELARVEERDDPDAKGRGGADYVTKYREYKYQETLFELFARQYELARADESREGALTQVLDAAMPPQRKSKPRRAVIALVAAVLGGLVASGYVVVRLFQARGRGRAPVLS